MLMRQIEADTLPWCRQHGVAVLVYWPLMKGLLAGKIRRDYVFGPDDSRHKYPMFLGEERQKNHDLVDRLPAIAQAAGHTRGRAGRQLDDPSAGHHRRAVRRQAARANPRDVPAVAAGSLRRHNVAQIDASPSPSAVWPTCGCRCEKKRGKAEGGRRTRSVGQQFDAATISAFFPFHLPPSPFSLSLPSIFAQPIWSFNLYAASLFDRVIFPCRTAMMVYGFYEGQVQIKRRGKHMPRSAATIFGLALAACSIGFNTVRYPMVWEMIGPARVGERALSSVPSPPAEPASHPPTPPPRAAPPSRPAPSPRKAEPIAVKPAPVVAQKSVAKQPQPAAAGPKNDQAAAGPKPAATKQVAAAPKPQKQLVPVTQVSLPNAPADAATIGTVIRRLPPVDPADPNTTARQRSAGGGWLDSDLSDDGN